MVVFCDHSLIQNCNGNHQPAVQHDTDLPYDKDNIGAPGAFGMLDLGKIGGRAAPSGSSEEAEWILHGFDKYLAAREVQVRPGREVLVRRNVQRRARRPAQHRPALPGLQDARRRTGRTRSTRSSAGSASTSPGYDVHGNEATLNGYFTQYIAQGILSEALALDRAASPQSIRRQVDSTHRITLSPQALHTKERKDDELPRQKHRNRRRPGCTRRHPDEHLRRQLQAPRAERREQGHRSSWPPTTSRPARRARKSSISNMLKKQTVLRKAIVAGAISSPEQLSQLHRDAGRLRGRAGQHAALLLRPRSRASARRSRARSAPTSSKVTRTRCWPARSRPATTSTSSAAGASRTRTSGDDADRQPRRPAQPARAHGGREARATVRAVTSPGQGAAFVQLRDDRRAVAEADLDREEQRRQR